MKCERWVINKYWEFYNKYGYIPHFFNPYNTIELKNICSTISTSTGAFTGVGTVLVATKKRGNNSGK